MGKQSTIQIAPRSRNEDAVFTGWQEMGSGELFALYTITVEDHPLYHSTVSEARLRSLKMHVPRTPSPYPDAAPPPWHTMGVELDNPATAREAMAAAKLDYTVISRPIKEILDVDNNDWTTMRTDRDEVLGIVPKNYEPLQNVDAFEFFDTLVTESEAIYETAGILGRGERIWMLAKLPGYIKVHGKDIIYKYLLLTNNHDDNSHVRVKVVPIRLACNNTLSSALKGEGEFHIDYTHDLRRVHSLLEHTNSLYERVDVIFNQMSVTKISDKQIMEYVNTLIPDTEPEEEHERTKKTREAILELHEKGMGSELAHGTLWGAFNSVTEYADHFMTEEDPANRLNSIWFGQGEELKEKAFRLAERMMQA